MKPDKFALQVSHRAILMLAAGVLAGSPALAQSGEPRIFAPAAPWTVGSTELSTIRGLKTMKLPCVITTEYDNGFVVRFSGGGGQLLAMAVDFRQDIFQQGRKYNAMLAVGDAYIKQVAATAFTANTLIFNLRPVGDMYNTLKTGKSLEIDIDGNAMTFDLGNLSEALPRLESCFKGEKSLPPVEPMVEPVKAADDLPPAQSKPKAMSMVDEEPVSDLTPLPLAGKVDPAPPVKRAAKNMPAKVPAEKPAAPAPLLPADVEQKTLPKNLDEIVQQSQPEPQQAVRNKVADVSRSQAVPAAETPTIPAANVPAPEPQSTPQAQPPRVSRREPVSTSAQSAPNQSQPGQGVTNNNPPKRPDIQPSVPPVAAQPLPLTTAQNQSAPLPAAAPSASAVQAPENKPLQSAAPASQAQTTTISVPVQAVPKTFDAKAGEDLKIVLARWAERAGYDLDWQSANEGKVVQDIQVSGSFEDAVTQLLAENAAATGLDAHIQDSSSRRNLPVKPKPAVSSGAAGRGSAPIEAVIPALHEQWQAPAGANIQTVIDQWAAKAGVIVVWQDYMSLPVKDDLSVDGTFENAVADLLDQYADDSARPVGQLNTDPETGQRTLLIRSEN